MPNPNSYDNKKDFVKACIPVVIKEGTAKNDEQAVAICNSMWDNRKSSKMFNEYLLADGAEPRNEIMLFPYGTFTHPTYGELKFDNEFFMQIIKNYENKVMGTLPFIDHEHDEGQALAWFTTVPYIRQGRGLFARPEWTSLGEKKVSEKIYRYFSPCWGPYTDPQTEKTYDNVLKGGAATNIPFLKTMPPISDDIKADDKMVEMKLSEFYMKVQSDDSIAGAESDEGEKESKSGKSGHAKNINKEYKMEKSLKEKLIKLYKLDEDASDEDVEKAVDEAAENNDNDKDKEIEELKKENEELKKESEEGEEKEEGESEEAKELKEQVSKLQKKLTESEKEKFLSDYVGKKIMPKDKEYWAKQFMADPEGSKERVLHMPDINLSTEAGSSMDEGENMSDSKLMDAAQEMFDKEKDRGNKTITLSECIIKVNQKHPELGREHAKKYMANCKYADRF